MRSRLLHGALIMDQIDESGLSFKDHVGIQGSVIFLIKDSLNFSRSWWWISFTNMNAIKRETGMNVFQQSLPEKNVSVSSVNAHFDCFGSYQHFCIDPSCKGGVRYATKYQSNEFCQSRGEGCYFWPFLMIFLLFPERKVAACREQNFPCN